MAGYWLLNLPLKVSFKMRLLDFFGVSFFLIKLAKDTLYSYLAMTKS